MIRPIDYLLTTLFSTTSGDVEALQCLKCMYHNDLIFREVVTAEEEVNDMEREPLLDTALDDDNDEVSWDSILILDDNESEA
jgi:hypothetical protein